jgi:hypothetical protein
MKQVFCAMLFCSCLVLARQARCAMPTAACGPDESKFNVKVQPGVPEPALSGSGMARVVFLETVDAQGPFVDTNVGARIGVDGAWIGAAEGDSRIVYSLPAGEHHLCANWQVNDEPFWKRTALSSFTAGAGKTYYFRVELSQKQYFTGSVAHSTDHSVRIEAVDADEGKYLATFLPIATSSPKK